jgi:hypothetical protein
MLRGLQMATYEDQAEKVGIVHKVCDDIAVGSLMQSCNSHPGFDEATVGIEPTMC